MTASASLPPLATQAAGQKRRRLDPTSAAASAVAIPGSVQLQLSRITLGLDSTRHAADVGLSNAALASYDIVAVRPGDAAAMRQAADSGAVDIIQLDLSSGRLPFPLRAEGVEHVLRAGLVFEISVAAAIRDGASRQYLVSNAASLLRLTRGRGFLLSSGARTPLELRSPLDTAAIASLFGVSRGAALAAMSESVQTVLNHAQLRRRRGPDLVLHVVPVALTLSDARAPVAVEHTPAHCVTGAGGEPLSSISPAGGVGSRSGSAASRGSPFSDPLQRIARIAAAAAPDVTTSSSRIIAGLKKPRAMAGPRAQSKAT